MIAYDDQGYMMPQMRGWQDYMARPTVSVRPPMVAAPSAPGSMWDVMRKALANRQPQPQDGGQQMANSSGWPDNFRAGGGLVTSGLRALMD